MKKLYFIFLVPLFLSAQNLEELVNLSIQNKQVDSSQKSLDSIKDEYESIKSGYMPSLDVGANHSITDKETSSVPKNSSKTYASISYELYDGGKKSDVYDSYESKIKSNQESVLALKNDIALNVITYYYNYLSYISQKEAKLKEIEQLDSELSRLSRFLDAGTTTEDEVQKIISRLESSKVSLQEIELQIITVLHNLEYITGQKVSIDAGSHINELVNDTPTDSRFDLKSLEYDLDTKLANSRSEKSAYLPTITLDNTFTYYDSDYNNDAFSNSLDHQNIASASLKWNIFSFGETKYKYESKYKEYLSSKLNYEYEKNKANIDLELAIKAYEISKLKIKSSEANLKAATTAYDVIKSKYQNGLIDNVSFLESLSEKFTALSQLRTSQNDLEIKKANILYYSGKKLEENIK
ncbi:RND family efflux system, outer membrane channel protein, TolC family [Arcobacter venerupis]|uniref:RND family efflux system, outer membrane channel protein, TolC family n=1 Tax=Arcobacter venerupis TaxID=1054033 RepID=A0AAE7B968_9BACT|nr:TolC family protein [Arcobacter venerupis]QKF67634.1 RND family efflux system, outer membrane channel protein, TolC family [Arcobacter venerupis]RWS49207.1 transporter [Arcobacter venerupis]